MIRDFFSIPKGQFLQLAFFYLIAHGGILFISNAVYWDDWTLFNMKSDVILDTFRQTGSIGNYTGHVHVFLLSFGPWLYKLLVFLLSFFTGLVLWLILKKQDWLSDSQAYYITLFFLIMPVFFARVALIDFVYVSSVFFFFLAWLLMERYRILALFLFFLSFMTQSLLVFYALPILDWYYRDSHEMSMNKLFKWSFSKIDFILLPFIWFGIKIFFFKPYGAYAGYNETYNLVSLFTSPFFMVLNFLKLNVNLPFTVLACSILLKLNILKDLSILKSNRMVFYVGLLALVLGTFPYFILGLTPTFDDWSSRHQLLMPLGLSFIMCWLICLSKHVSHRKIYIAFFIATSLVLSIKNYIDFYEDWQKQKLLIEYIRHSDELKKSSLILIEDETVNALNREVRFYEWNGIFKYAFNDESRFSVSKAELSDYFAGKYDEFFSPMFSAASHVRNRKNGCVILMVNKSSLGDMLLRSQPLYTFHSRTSDCSLL